MSSAVSLEIDFYSTVILYHLFILHALNKQRLYEFLLKRLELLTLFILFRLTPTNYWIFGWRNQLKYLLFLPSSNFHQFYLAQTYLINKSLKESRTKDSRKHDNKEWNIDHQRSINRLYLKWKGKGNNSSR